MTTAAAPSQPPSSTALVPSESVTPQPHLSGPSLPTFPPPETFDFIPQTHDLLLRLLPPQPSSQPGTNLVPLEPKDIDAEASRIRIKIQKARGILNDLPDISRSIEEQKDEITELEEKIKRQREVLGKIRELKAVRDAVAAGYGKSEEMETGV
ncbi:hypothetical protein ABW19_dt0206200 [Dactylella cylindrospora]|nr:hypothetical protein ABW19_dt0206200 [Dactylella cylindrospora]